MNLMKKHRFMKKFYVLQKSKRYTINNYNNILNEGDGKRGIYGICEKDEIVYYILIFKLLKTFDEIPILINICVFF